MSVQEDTPPKRPGTAAGGVLGRKWDGEEDEDESFDDGRSSHGSTGTMGLSARRDENGSEAGSQQHTQRSKAPKQAEDLAAELRAMEVSLAQRSEGRDSSAGTGSYVVSKSWG